ncbi:RNA polymerase sigma factor [Microbacterium terrisoli]|uniref:RNA polymerase sigma factor n=1 Tax=Microbacterium terrisoli TaxID=3242192 RepID=UPI0028041DD7|nr:sigma-70 family RNA polymerase sigma factor [Microbacterium protaetiae]
MTLSDSAEPADQHDEATPRWERAGELFAAWRDGDAHAMDELVRLMTPPLWHMARAYRLDSALAEDVVQTTWLTLLRRHEAIDDPRAVSGWLGTTARREAWRVLRAHRRVDATEADRLERHLGAQESAEDEAERGLAAQRLWAAVTELTERCQRLLRIVAFDERPDYARIAHDLSMPVGSIGPTRQRCLAKLRALLGDDTQAVTHDA